MNAAAISVIVGLLIVGIAGGVAMFAVVTSIKAALDHPDTGIAARLTLIAQRVHDNANDTLANKMRIESLERRVDHLEES